MKRTANGISQIGQCYFEQDMQAAELRRFACGTAAVFSRRCPGKEDASEDAAALIPCHHDSGVLVVADGLGGQRAGDQASCLAIQQIEQCVALAAVVSK